MLAFSVERIAYRKCLSAVFFLNAIRYPLIAIACLLWVVNSAFACPSCQEAIASQSDPILANQLLKGYARSIAILMWTPYLLFAGITSLIVHSARRSQRGVTGNHETR